MRWLITGLNGTLAPRLAAAAQATGVEVIGWDRTVVDPDDAAAGAALLQRLRPDAIAHLATGGVGWAARLAGHAARQRVPFLFTSTAMVFHHEPDGPHRVHDERTAQDDYGRHKIACEDAVRAACADAMVVRLGWQIDAAQPGNNMLFALDGWQAREGRVAASRLWWPACSFMDDSAAAMLRWLQRPAPGTHHVDSNAAEGHDFAALARALKAAHGRDAWRVEAVDGYRHDQRLAGGDAAVPPLSWRLPALRAAAAPGAG